MPHRVLQRAAVLEADRDRSEARKMVAQPQGAVVVPVALEGSVLAGNDDGHNSTV